MDFDFNLIYYRHNKYGHTPIMNKSEILFTELTFVFNGSMTYFVNDADITLSAGDAIMIPQNAFRERQQVTTPMNYVSFNFVAAQPLEYPLFMKSVIGNEIKLLIVALDELNRDKSFFEKYSSSLILASILHCIRLNLEKNNENPTVQVIENYLFKNYPNKIRLGDIADLTYFSAAYCDELFQKTKGKYIIDYLIDIRINEAKSLLIEGVLPLSAIAEKTGFNDYNYFSRLFKKRAGYSPKAFQNMIFKKQNS